MTISITGACQCGAIRYEAEGDPAMVTLCHCADCQHFSGSPWRASIPVSRESLKFTGKPAVYIKTADSGRQRAQGFCGTCGSSLYATTPGDDAVYNMRLGNVDQRADLPPQKQIWCESALPWSADISALPCSPKQ